MATMSDRIITLNGEKQPRKLRGSDFITVNEAMNMVLNAVGPVARVVEEMRVRQMAIEDHTGYVHPEPPGDLPPQAPSPGGDSE